MSKESIRKPSILIGYTGGAVSAEGININLAINTVPSVEVVLHSGLDDDVYSPVTSEMISRMRRLQTLRLLGADSRPNVSISAYDGGSGIVDFRGYLAAPVLERRPFSTNESAQVVGLDAFLNGLGLSMYKSRTDVNRPEEVDDLFENTPNKTTGNVAKTILEISNILFGNITATLAEAELEAVRVVIENKHEANKPAMEVWRKILANSELDYKEWRPLLLQLNKLSEALIERIKEMLQQRTASFWDILNAMAAEFLFFYAPNVDGSSGRLLRSTVKTGPATETYSGGITRLSAVDGNVSMLPLGGVIVYGPTYPKVREEEAVGGASNVVGQWPREIRPGFYQEISAPAWIAHGAGGNFENFSTRDPFEPPTKKNFNPADFTARATTIRDRIDNLIVSITELLNSFAKMAFEDMLLSDSTATLDMPLNFNIKVGARYSFDVGNGAKFSGFVYAAKHILNLQGGNTMISGTSVSLSHVRYE